jgi:acid stress-induced BolA-like protein IbaG/YrbA
MMVEAKAIPDNETLSRAANIDVINVKGDNVKFGLIIERKTIVVFIRGSF